MSMPPVAVARLSLLRAPPPLIILIKKDKNENYIDHIRK
jgi:hypothetical protein